MAEALRYLPDHGADMSFEAIYRAERSKLIRYLMSIGVGQHQADDAVQSTFARAYDRWDTIRHPHAWLYKVALRESYGSRPVTAPARSRLGMRCPIPPRHLTPATWSS